MPLRPSTTNTAVPDDPLTNHTEAEHMGDYGHIADGALVDSKVRYLSNFLAPPTSASVPIRRELPVQDRTGEGRVSTRLSRSRQLSRTAGMVAWAAIAIAMMEPPLSVEMLAHRHPGGRQTIEPHLLWLKTELGEER